MTRRPCAEPPLTERDCVQHARYCRTRGQTPAQVIAAVGQPVPDDPGWDDTIEALMRAVGVW